MRAPPSNWLSLGAVSSAIEGDLQAEVDEFMANVPAAPRAMGLEERITYISQFQSQLHGAGLAVVDWPLRFGGRGLEASAAAAVWSRLGELGAPEIVNYVGIHVLAPTLLRVVDAERLARWLPPMASAEEVWCQLFSEPDAGSDLGALSTRAVPDNGGWRITGQKTWSTWAHYAKRGLLLARTGAQRDRHRGITAFVVDMESRGIEVRPLRAMTGEAEFAEVFFDGAEVSEDALVGEVGGGWGITMNILESERGPYAIYRAATFKRVFQHVLDRVRTTPVDVIRRDELVRALISVRLLDLQLARVSALTEAAEVAALAPLLKRMLSDTEQRVFDTAMDVLGPAGGAWECQESEWNTGYLYSRAASIYGGTAQVQRNLIGERVLGLPR